MLVLFDVWPAKEGGGNGVLAVLVFLFAPKALMKNLGQPVKRRITQRRRKLDGFTLDNNIYFNMQQIQNYAIIGNEKYIQIVCNL